MYASSLIRFLIISYELMYKCSTEKNISENYLPLVFILQNKKFHYPSEIKNAIFDENGEFTGDTLFSTNNSNNQMFFCPIESEKQSKQIETYNKLIETTPQRFLNHLGDKTASKNCLFRKIFEKKEPLRCADDATPAIHMVDSGVSGTKARQYCGPEQQGVLIKFVYEICASFTLHERILLYMLTIRKFKLEKYLRKLPFVYKLETVYEICYNPKEKKTIYTVHSPASSELLFDKRLEHEKTKKYTLMSNADEIFNDKDEFSQWEEFYDRLLKNPTTQNQSTNDKKSGLVEIPEIYLPEQLVPSDDLMTAVLKKPTFHYINVKPMHQGLVDLWNYMADLIRKNFIGLKPTDSIKIYTGAFTNIDHAPRDWLADIPLVWIKIIHKNEMNIYRSSSLVIVMKNNYKPREEGSFHYESALDGLCSTDYCKSFKQNEQVLNRFSHLLEKIRCCPFNDRIDAFFNLRLAHDNKLLPIANLTDKIENRRQSV